MPQTARPSHPPHALPLPGPLARLLGQDIPVIFHILVFLLAIFAVAVYFFGLPALTLAALAAVPVMLGLLLAIARP